VRTSGCLEKCRARLGWGAGLRQLVALFACGFSALVQAMPARAQMSAAEAAQPPLSVAVFVSSRDDQCFTSGLVPAIRQLAKAEEERINAAGGILRRRVQLDIFDDQRNPDKAVANFKAAVANPNTVAMVGLSGTEHAKPVFDKVGRDIGSSGIPFFSDVTVNALFEAYPNVFTMRPSQDEERLPAMAAFIKAQNMQRVAFVGLKDQVFSSSLGDGLKNAGVALVADHRLAVSDNKIDPAAMTAVIDDLKQKNAGLVILAIGGSRTVAVLKDLTAAGVSPPIFVIGSLENIIEQGGGDYPGDLFQLAWDNLPHAFSDRLRERVARNGLGRWVFGGTKNPAAPGWKSGACKDRPGSYVPEVFDRRNMNAIGRGTQYADMVGLVADALKGADPASNTATLRAYLLAQLKNEYASGKGAFRGSFENWSFRPQSRSADRTPFVVMRPAGSGRSQLAPIQFVRLRTDKLRQIDTLYLDIDLIRAFRVDDNDKSFFAEFYLSMRGKGASIEKIEFANAFLETGSKNSARQVSIRELHKAGRSEVYPEEMSIYHVSGKFTFEPRLATYPFDTQRFSVNIQPASGNSPFIIQPPPQALRDKAVETDGWALQDQYVGYDEDFVPTIDAWTFRQSIVPFYKASFVWMMKRQTTDYYLRVVVPLAFILAVAYMSIFIPLEHFEAIVTIQVTALLSAVALYLALPKIDAGDGTTMSDRIFLFVYTGVSLMIVFSILRVSRPVAHVQWLRKALGLVHMVLVPILVALMALYVYRASLGHDAVPLAHYARALAG
jgi:hypothetical protein